MSYVTAHLACGIAVTVVAFGAVTACYPGDAGAEQQQPPRFPTLLFATQYTPEELADVALSLQVSSYRVMPTIKLTIEKAEENGLVVIGELVMLDGVRLRFGDTMTAGDSFQRGLLWNRSAVDAVVSVHDTDATVNLPPNTMLSVGAILSDRRLLELTSGDCSVSCPGEKAYACCNYGEPPSCQCYLYGGVSPGCESGGAGSSYCELNQGETRNRCEVDCDEGYSACCKASGDGHPKCTCREDNSDFSDCNSGGQGASSCRQGEDVPAEPE